jgi:hypothetical protein
MAWTGRPRPFAGASWTDLDRASLKIGEAQDSSLASDLRITAVGGALPSPGLLRPGIQFGWQLMDGQA